MSSWVRRNPSVLKMGKGIITFCTKTRISTTGNSSIRVADEVPDLIKSETRQFPHFVVLSIQLLMPVTNGIHTIEIR